MLEEGYAAVTYRHVAAKAGVTGSLVQYYFPTLDNLFVALLRRRTDRNFEELTEALYSQPKNPLLAIWEHSRDETTAALMMEMLALSNHRKAIRAEISATGERARKLQLDALSGYGGMYYLPAMEVSPEAMLLLLSCIPKLLLMDMALGVTTGHEGALAFMQQLRQAVPRHSGNEAEGS